MIYEVKKRIVDNVSVVYKNLIERKIGEFHGFPAGSLGSYFWGSIRIGASVILNANLIRFIMENEGNILIIAEKDVSEY